MTLNTLPNPFDKVQPIAIPSWIDSIPIDTYLPFFQDKLVREILRKHCQYGGIGIRDQLKKFIRPQCWHEIDNWIERIEAERSVFAAKEKAKLEAAQVAAKVEATKAVAHPIVAPPKTFAEKAQLISSKFHSDQISAAEYTRAIEALNKEEREELAAIKSIALASIVPTLATPQPVPLPPISTRAQLEMKFEQRGRLLMSQHLRGEINSNELVSKLKALRQETKFWLKQLVPPGKEIRK